MSTQAQHDGSLDVAQASRHYRSIWRCCLIAGFLGMLGLTPLVTAVQVDLEVAAGGAPGAGLHDAIERGVVLDNWAEVVIAAASLGCLLAAGRLAPRSVVAGTVLLCIGALLVLKVEWILIEDILTPGEQSIGVILSTGRAGIWLLCAMGAAIALLRLARVRAAAQRGLFLADMAAFEVAGHRRGSARRTYRPSRLVFMILGAICVLIMAIAIQYSNGVLLRQYVLGIPRNLYRDPQAHGAFVEAHPLLAVTSAVADVAQIILTIVLAVVILRFFWRLVVADAKRLLDDPSYRPIVFLRSFGDDQAKVTSKRLFDRLVWRKRRLEEIAVAALAPLGAAIAIGQPGERLPRLGAMRAYYPDEQWQDAVLEWMRRAKLIVLVGGASRWTLWELQQVLERGYHAKLLLVLPQEQSPADREERWRALSQTTSNTSWESAFATFRPPGLLVAGLGAGFRLRPVIGDARQQSDYEAALRLAAVDMLAATKGAADDGASTANTNGEPPAPKRYATA